MVKLPDFLGGSGQDHFRPEFQVESPEGELHLRFYIPSHQEFALPGHRHPRGN
jgi:purine-binding chemotaxis protein CheW